MAEAIGILEARGAVVVDPVTLPSTVSPDLDENFLTGPGVGSVVFTYGMKRDFNAWLNKSDTVDLETDRDAYERDLAWGFRVGAERGIDAAMEEHDLDALFFPGSRGADIAAHAGYPTVLVPFTRVPAEVDPPLPEGFEPRPRPFGVSFSGMACSEPRLLELAYAFEQATLGRVAPPGMD